MNDVYVTIARMAIILGTVVIAALLHARSAERRD
jgi:hypothetical protein